MVGILNWHYSYDFVKITRKFISKLLEISEGESDKEI